jgi:hypothetical protein
MEPRPLLRVAGPAWEIARTFLLLAYLAVAFSASSSADLLSAPWLAAAGAAGLVMPAAFVMYALAPDRHGAFLPLLRLGKALEAATVLLLFATGAVTGSGTMPGPHFAAGMLSLQPLTFGLVLVLDLLVLTGLLRTRGRP